MRCGWTPGAALGPGIRGTGADGPPVGRRMFGTERKRAGVACARLLALALGTGCAQGVSFENDPLAYGARPALAGGTGSVGATSGTGVISGGSGGRGGSAAGSGGGAGTPFAGEACSRDQELPCVCDNGGEGVKMCMANMASPTGGVFGPCVLCSEPPMAGAGADMPDGGVAGMSGRGGSSGGTAGSGMSGRGGSSGGAAGSGGRSSAGSGSAGSGSAGHSGSGGSGSAGSGGSSGGGSTAECQRDSDCPDPGGLRSPCCNRGECGGRLLLSCET